MCKRGCIPLRIFQGAFFFYLSEFKRLFGEFVIQINEKLKINFVNSQVYCNSNVYSEIILPQYEKFGTTLSFKFEKFRSTRALFFYEKCRSFHMNAMFNANLKFDHGYHTQKFAPPLILHFILGTVAGKLS